MNKIKIIALISLQLFHLISSSSISFNLTKNSLNKLPKTALLQQALSFDKNAFEVLQTSSSSPSQKQQLTKFQRVKQITSDIQNYYNFQYLGTLQLGNIKKPLTFIFDTGSNQLWFPTIDCDQCPAGFHRYDTSQSSTYRRTSDKPEAIQYGKGRIVGFPSEQQVWFSDDDKIDNMPCLAVTIEEDLYGTVADGILGLAPLQVQNQPPFLLDLMKNNGLIDERTISFSYNDIGQDSLLVFGQPVDGLIPEASQKISVPIEFKGILYFIQLKQITYGGTQLHYSYLPALIDTGTSLIAAPVHDVGMFLTYIITQYGNISICQNGSLYCIECSKLNKNEDLIFDLQDEQQARIGFDELWRDLSDDGMCELMIIPIQSDMWILGDVFIRRYYTVIDYDNGVVEMYDKNASERMQSNVRDLKNNDEKGIETIEWIALAIISILIVLTLVCMFKHLCGDRGDNRYYSKIVLQDDMSSDYALLENNERN